MKTDDSMKLFTYKNCAPVCLGVMLKIIELMFYACRQIKSYDIYLCTIYNVNCTNSATMKLNI